MSLDLLFLGTGTSAGIPMIGCDCAVCHSTDPRDRRSRASVLIGYDETSEDNGSIRRQILIDTTPELRLQMTGNHINRVDAVLYTHAHADHIFGLDDLRRFNVVMNGPVHIHAEESVLTTFRQMFRYIFEPHTNANKSFVAELIAHAVEPLLPVELFGAKWTPLRLMHGRLPIVGFRVDHGGHAIAYCTDVSVIPQETWPLLEGLDVLVIDALRYRPHPTHMTIDQAIEGAEVVKPKQTYFTHIAHDISHAEVAPRLPENVFLAWDGLRVRCGK